MNWTLPLINLYAGNNTIEVELIGLKDASDNSYINDATVTATIHEEDGTTEVTGETWPISLAYVTASNGDYRGVVSADSNIVARTKYQITISATDADGNKGEWINFAIASRRMLT